MEKETLNSNSNEDEHVENNLNMEKVLLEVGEFGPYQLRVAAVAMIVVIFFAFSSTEYLFNTARIKTRCLINECENGTQEFAPAWLQHAIPTAGSSLDQCHRYANATTLDLTLNCSADLFDPQIVVPCDQYVYESENTIVYDFGLACDEWRRTLIGSARTLGTLFSQPVTGYVSDRWGRRTALVINAVNAACIGLIRCFAKNYTTFLLLELLEASLGAGIYISAYLLLMETVGSRYRVTVGSLTGSFYALGQVVLGVLSWFFPYWRHLALIIYSPQILAISYFWIMPESIRWYISKGYHDKAEKALKDFARVNGKELSEKTLVVLTHSANDEQRKADEPTIKEPWLIVEVCRHKSVLFRCLIAPIWWITSTLIYYGLSINSVNLSLGNKYMNYMLVSVIEIPGYWIAVSLLGRVGRKPVLAGAFWISALCQLGYLLIPSGYPSVSLTVYMIGKCSIAAVVSSVYTYTAELFPTRRRHSLVAFCSMLGRIGAIFAPLTPSFGERLPFLIFAVMAALSGALVLTTPETLGAQLPDTMEQADSIGKTTQRK